MADIGRYFPDFIKDVREFKALGTAENPEIDGLYSALEAVMGSQFVETASEYSVSRLETITGIRPKGTDSLDERKFRLIAKFNEYLPYTWRGLVKMLDGICGEKGYEKERDVNGFLVTVRVGLANRPKLETVRELLENVVPVNMGIDLSILYNRHYETAKYRHSLLKGYTHREIRERGIPVFTEHRFMKRERINSLEGNAHVYIREEMYKN